MARLFEVERVRDQFPALRRTYKGQQVVYFDGPGGSQVVQSAMDAMVQYMSRGGANLHGVFPSSVETEQMTADTKSTVAAFLNAAADEVAFGPNMTTLNLAISRALSRTWEAGDEVVVSELDHRANVDPWLLAARDRGAGVKWLTVNTETLTLDLDHLEDVITERTKLVAVGLASNSVGTITDVRRIAARAHEVGALVAVDAVHAAPHLVIDRDALGADILLCSAYKFFGPHVGIAVIRRELFEELDVYKLRPAPTDIPEKLETGTQNHEGIAGVGAAIRFIGSLGAGATLRDRLVNAMTTIAQHEDALARKLRQALRDMPGVTVYAAPHPHRKTPTIAFRVDGLTPRQVCEALVEQYGIFVADGDFYATTLADKLGINTSGGWIRAGLAPYNTDDEVDTLIEAMEHVVRART
ncbi:cysteine desulfurase-like protein [Alicyclobacillus pomorum]|uniref:cysteine desulfurase-like protein n=1 Tax=Alicyclobacillus pomorum TaxID=204470 RepID=UPI000426EB84|nr:cysteine desulfurase-like protein [Alicyclobacillus pomorum]